MSRWVYLGEWLYERSGRFAVLIGPFLLVFAALSFGWNSLVMALIAAMCLLYYIASISTALTVERRKYQELLHELERELPVLEAVEQTSRPQVFMSEQLQQALADLLRRNERLRSETHFSGQALERLAKGSKDTASNQRQRLEMIATAAEEIAQTVHHIRALGQHAISGFRTVHNNSVAGFDEMQHLRRVMDEIIRSLSSTTEAVAQLLERTETIGGFVHTIQGVAKQTQLLALNASIEAARAGEHGRGFAVVADEVRLLATSTESATRDITQIIEQIGAAVEEVHQHVDKHRALLEQGEVRSAHLGEALQSLASLSRTNLDGLAGLQHALDEHALASHSLSEQLQEVNSMVFEHSNQADRLLSLTGYLTRLTEAGFNSVERRKRREEGAISW